MKKIITILSISAFLLTALPAHALIYKSVLRVNGTAAEAFWESVSGPIVAYTYVVADVTNLGSDVYLEVGTYDTDLSEFVSCNFGYLFTSSTSVFTVNKLNTATLNPTSIELYDCFTWESAGTSTVAADWVGVGKTQKGRFSFKSKSTGFSEMFKSSSTFRSASATGSLNSSPLGTALFADMVQFKYMDLFKVK